MKYERLTEGYFECSRCEKGICEIPNSLCKDSLYCEIHNRLFDLEDKIESGEIISVIQSEQGEQEIAYFVKHNAAVRKQAVIEFAVRLKKKADSYNDEENYIDRSVMYTDIDDLVTEVCGE